MRQFKLFNYLSFMVVTLILSQTISAQQWRVYDASVVPAQTTGMSLDLATVSQNTPGPNFIEAIMDDPHVAGNKILKYFQPDAQRTDLSGAANKMYQSSFATAWTDSSFTIVTRIKGSNIDTVPRAFDIQWRNGNARSRDELRIFPNDSTIQLQRANKTVKVDADLNAWHVYRVAVVGDSAAVFLDEDPTPVVTGITTVTVTDKYIKIGDGDAAKVCGYVDWFILDTSNAFAPATGAPIPDSLLTTSGTGSGLGFGKKVLFLTNTANKALDGTYADSLWVVDLKAEGFDVTVPVYETMKVIDTDEKKQVLKDADAIIIGRGTSSGDFDDYATGDDKFWEKVQTPIVLMSNNHARASHMRWLPVTATQDVARFGVLNCKVMNPADAMFTGITIPPADSILPFLTDNMGMVVVPDSMLPLVNGEVIAELVNGPEAYKISTTNGDTTATVDLSKYNGNPLIIRWAPGDSMYNSQGFSGNKAVVPLGWRTYITGGDDHDWDYTLNKRKLAFYSHSAEIKKALVNELLYLMLQEVPALDDNNKLDTLVVSVGTLSPAFTPDNTNYGLEVPATTSSVTISATAESALAVITGTGEYTTIPGTATISVKAENDDVKEYVILISKEVIVEDTTILKPGVGTLDDAISAAADGDIIYLKNREKYTILGLNKIDKKITIMAKIIDTLPDLDDLPIIENTYGDAVMFRLEDKCDLSIIGVDIDAGMGTYIFSPSTDTGVTISLYVNRSRLHNTTDNIFHQTSDYDARQTLLKSMIIKNSFLYDNGIGHGIYTKNYRGGENEYIFENVTFWNIGQQFNWMRSFPADVTQKCTYNHMTGYNLSTSTADNKELFGNSDGDNTTNESKLDITVKNSIFSTQVSTNDGSFRFVNEKGNHTVSIHHNVLYNLRPILNLGTVTVADNMEGTDPQFADAAGNNFTVGNTSLHAAADDGKILGAVYWHPSFVDDFSDVSSGVGFTPVEQETYKLFSAPNPFTDATSISFTLESKSAVEIRIYDITGKLYTTLLKEVLETGAHTVDFNGSLMEAGIYYCRISTDRNTETIKMVKY